LTNKRSTYFKRTLLGIILAVLFLPLLQARLKWIAIQPLNGALSEPEYRRFSWDDWFASSYQEKKEQYVNACFGFRNTCVRLNNQLDFWFFRQANANGVIVGKEYYLYEQAYIDAYNGTDFIGQDSIVQTARRIEFLSEQFKRRNKQLIVVFAAGKASYYPAFFPERFRLQQQNKRTNYFRFKQQLATSTVNFIDFNAWFLELKKTSNYPLFPKLGIHWSHYGMTLAADSLIKNIERVRQVDLGNIVTKNVATSNLAQFEDKDIGDGMNLLFDVPGLTMAYPEFHFEQKETKKPNVLVVSDSFFWGMYNAGISSVFDQTHFWYYNKQVYPEFKTKELFTDQVNFEQAIKANDVFIILATEANLKAIGWGFLERAERYFKQRN
jgi:hypothetical protein